MSREDPRGTPDPTPTGGTPIWVWVVYCLGILAATIFVSSILFVLGAYLTSDDVPVTFGVSALAIVLWGGLIALALATWFVRRRGGRR